MLRPPERSRRTRGDIGKVGVGAGFYILLDSFIRNINRPKEAIMKQSSRDQAEGTLHEVKGKLKEKLGRATNKPNLEDEGTEEKVSGKVQKKVGQVERVFEK
jgi:uncharacterized protein YjbJ (UPF0337 family)